MQKTVHLIPFSTLTLEQVSINNQHLSLDVLNYGAIIRRLRFRTANRWEDMVVGFEEPEAYLQDVYSLGACVGRYAGRLSGGFLEIGGKQFAIPHSDGVTLHGGRMGFAKRYWEITSVRPGGAQPEIRLKYRSKHLEEGFPGNLEVLVIYRLEANALLIRHEAISDRPTVVNLTNHSYYKIDPQPLNAHYEVQLNATRRLETDHQLLPTGRLLPVSGTDFDFLQKRPLGETKLDTPYVLDGGEDPAAKISSRISGVGLTVFTNQPCLVVYTPVDFTGICLETQNFPDAPGFDHFPPALLQPGATYVNESRFVFEGV